MNKKVWILWAALMYMLTFLLFFCRAAFTDSLDYRLPFMAYGGTFKYHYWYICGMKVSLYWCSHVVGVVGMMVMCYLRRRRFGYSGAFAAITAFMLAFMGYIGAKLLYTFENWEKVLQEGFSINGVSFFGTVFFMPAAIYAISEMAGIEYKGYLDYCTPAGLLMLICIRTGCFLNGCCHGKYIEYKKRPIVFPSQLLECVIDLLLLYALVVFQDKIKNGRLYIAFLGGYGILRFVVELTRDTDKSIMGMSNGQIFSVVCVFVMFIFIIYDFLVDMKMANQRRSNY